jgi:hypothetical protein
MLEPSARRILEGAGDRMKKAFAISLLTACAVASLVSSIAAQSPTDPAKMLQIFSSPIKTDGGTFQVIILNDRTVDAIFGNSPAKAAFRTKARMVTVFFVQGTANKEFEFKPDATIVQKGETLEGKPTPMSKNFAAGKVGKGEKVQGLIELPKKLDLFEPFKFTMNGQTAEFRLNEDDVRDYGNR